MDGTVGGAVCLNPLPRQITLVTPLPLLKPPRLADLDEKDGVDYPHHSDGIPLEVVSAHADTFQFTNPACLRTSWVLFY